MSEGLTAGALVNMINQCIRWAHGLAARSAFSEVVRTCEQNCIRRSLKSQASSSRPMVLVISRYMYNYMYQCRGYAVDIVRGNDVMLGKTLRENTPGKA